MGTRLSQLHYKDSIKETEAKSSLVHLLQTSSEREVRSVKKMGQSPTHQIDGKTPLEEKLGSYTETD